MASVGSTPVTTQPSYEYVDNELHLPGHRVYDRLFEEIFDRVIRGISREGLINLVLESLFREEGGQKLSSALAAVVLESQQTSGGWTDYSGFDQRNLNEEHWQNYCKTLSSQTSSTFLQEIIRKGRAVELQYSGYLGYEFSYKGELDNLFTSAQYKQKAKGFWLAAFPLSGEDEQLVRCLIMLYPNVGDEYQPQFPGGALQELRLLRLVARAYKFLYRRLSGLSQQLSQERSRIINSLGPAILHHELGHYLSSSVNNLNELVIPKLIKLIEGKFNNTTLSELAADSTSLCTHLQSAYQITDTFNQLDKKTPSSDFALSKVIEGAIGICKFRLTQSGLSSGWGTSIAKTKTMRFILHSDEALLLHLLVNIISNACIACTDYRPKPKAKKKLVWESRSWRQQAGGEWVGLRISNNGPVIPLADRDHIFEQGFTRRASGQEQGHGQGLYLCQQIAMYLGGSIRLLPGEELPAGMHVGFELTIPARIPPQGEL